MLWEYLEGAGNIDSPELNLSESEKSFLIQKVRFAVSVLLYLKQGIVYGWV